MIFNVPIDVIIDMGMINPKIVDLKTLVLFSAFPFNLLKGLRFLVLLLCFIKDFLPY